MTGASVVSVTQNSYQTAEVARAYDSKNSGRDDFEFYLRLAEELSAGDPAFAVLDIGCGTGALGVQMAAAGHRVIGVDPSDAMLDVARNRPGGGACTWVHGFANDVPDAVADLAVMTGHVAQYFLTEEAWVEVLTEASRALRPGGWLAFESRNPGRRAWERWTPEHTTRRLPHPDGGELTTWIELLDVDEDASEGVLETHRGITIYPDGHRSGDESSETLIFRPGQCADLTGASTSPSLVVQSTPRAGEEVRDRIETRSTAARAQAARTGPASLGG